MKKTLFCLVLMLSATSLFSQNAYYDAIKLRQYFSNGKFIIPTNTADSVEQRLKMEEYFIIINSYYNNKFKKPKDIHDNLADFDVENPNPDYNPFLAPYLSPGTVLSFANIPTAVSKFISTGVSSLGSLNVTNLADGLARFLIKRGKEELNVAFFNRMKAFLDNPEYPECKTLFPVTTEFLNNIDVARYAEFLQSLREAFHKDLSNLITSLNQMIDLPKYTKLLANLPEIRISLRSLRIVSELSQSGKGILPDSLIHQLSLLSEWKEIDFNLAGSWHTLDVISQSVRFVPATTDSVDHRQRWISLSDMNTLIQDDTTLTLYLGLLYQKMEDISFKANNTLISVQQYMAKNKNNLLQVASLTENFITLANDVDRTIQDIREKQSSKQFTPEDYYTYINKSINIFEYGFKVAAVIHPDFVDNRYIRIARNGNNLYKNIYTKNYNNAVTDVYQIFNLIFDKKETLIAEKVNAVADSSTATTLHTTLTTNLSSLKLPSSKLIEGFLKYGNFMASVIKAESAEDVEQALDAAALPSGSYSIKQKSDLNISVNAYIGYSRDYLSVFNDQYAHGIYAPLGISVSHGTRKKHGFSFTGFVSLIDVGSVAAYRLQSGNDENLKQEVRLESIYSPSAQLLIEYRGLPLAIGGGWRRTPKLFYAGNSSFNVVSPKSVFNFSVLLDIPLFTIHNRPFDKK